jgi:hypothetical protein
MYTLADLPKDDQGCFDQIIALLYPDGVICPWQSHSKTKTTLKYLWCGICRRKWSLKKQVGFGSSKLGWRQILELVTCWCGKQSPGDIITSTGLSYWTIQRWLERLRARLPEDQEQLVGLLEIDESFLGHQKYGNQEIVMGIIDDSPKIRLGIIPDVEQDSIEGFLDQYATVGSLICADAHASHLGLMEVGYGLEICNHSMGHFGPTNRIENVWSCLDRFVIRTRDKFLRRFLPGILREFQARKNHPELFASPFILLKSLAVPF